MTVTRTAPPNAPTGVTAVADHGFEKIYNMESGSLVDRTTEMTNGTSLPTVFANDDDYIYFGVPVLYRNGTASSTASNRDCRFVDIHVDLETVASSSITPTFQYSNGDNSWATLTVVDGTNGFTQSGTITFTRASMPSHTTWLVATKDGSGATIGDGVARGYVRIRRTANTLTTAPIINTIGTGILSASTTYYYKVCNFKITTSLSAVSGAALRSLPSTEVSATTTTTARCVKISWNADTDSDFQAVWRTPTSGDYTTGQNSTTNFEKLNTNPNNQCDVGVQQVKATYLNAVSGLTRYQDFVIDNGINPTALYNATYLLYTNYNDRFFRDYERGLITVSGGSSRNPENFKNIVTADLAGGWNAFIQNNLFPTSLLRTYTCRDNILITGVFTDSSFVLDSDSYIYYNGASTLSFATFGRYDITDSLFWSRGGIFIQTGETANQSFYQFNNSIFYNCLFLDNPIEISSTSRTYCQLQFLNSCQLYDCSIQANSQYDAINFNGTNIIMQDVNISNARYGLNITTNAQPTIITSGITLNGTSGIYTESYIDGGTYFFNKYNFNGVTRPVYNPYAVNKYNHTYYLVDCNFNACDPEDTVFGANSVLYRDWTVNLTILDKDGNPIENADVTIKDATETISHSLQTDSNGKISQATTVAKYLPGTIFNVTYGSKYADDITYYDDFVIQISKTGYETYSLPPMTIDKTIDMVIKLRPQKQLAITNDGIYVNTDPKNKTDTLSLIKI